QPLYDPFCGSGTIVIEAAQIAAGIPPGAQRRFGFERLLGHDAQAWERTRADAMRGAAAAGAPIAASDAAEREVAQARINAKRAGLAESAIRLSVADALRAPPPFEPPAMIVTNPPYGERSRIDADRDQQAAIERWGMALKHRYGGWTVAVLSSDLQLARRLGIKALRRTPLYNGPIECRLFSARILPPFASRSAT
ncbi:MAG TPA: hypothetical protein VM491_01620, partial [Burkholderiaceae bacterium]|nr:hypothetical protein [Burkholderiaceae bacterium]